jgi:TetR/AcrR family transcriptional regulator, mexCD-oprJ operon repressor
LRGESPIVVDATIAKAAGVSRPTLYSHFPTREDLIEAAMDRALADAQRDIAASRIDDGPPRETLQRLVTAGWRTLARNLAIARAAHELLPPDRIRRIHKAAFEPVRQLIARGQQASAFCDDQPMEWMVTVLYALLHAAADEVINGRLDSESAAALIHGTTLGAFRS